MRKAVLSIVAASVIATSVAMAGGHKCTMSTQECLNAMAAKFKSSGWIGVVIDRGEDDLWVVNEVVAGSPAERAGILPGDVLYAMNGIPMLPKNDAKLQKVRGGLTPGSSITYTVRRNGSNRDFTMTLDPMPANLIAKYIGEHMLEHAMQDQEQLKSKEPSKGSGKDPSKDLSKDPSKNGKSK